VNEISACAPESIYLLRTAQVGGKHLQAFVRHRLENGIAGRTVANEMSHLRAVLKHVGKQELARNPICRSGSDSIIAITPWLQYAGR
jgi:hypothetical protein